MSHRDSPLDRAYPIIVHSHLGWDWVWQRPQQFLSRLSARHPILFVEGPLPIDGLDQPVVEVQPVAAFPNVTVVRTRMPAARWSDGAWVDAERRRLLQELLAGPLGRRFARPVQWFYDPMAVTAFAGHMDERATVFDCMDQLSQFRGAPPELMRREHELLTRADVVFAGGPKIGREKSRVNPNTHAYGCGVDVPHFSQARRDSLALPADVADLPRPVFGFFGVVDERMDYDLIAALADATPHGSVVMIGPWTKVDPDQIPRRPNLHWLGGRDYQQLPSYARAFDVCLMPFALNEATEFINPTKAMEYMATGRPVVSTAVDDVVLQFSDVALVARSHAEFIALCHEAARAPDRARTERGIAMAEQNTWESVVARLEGHIEDALFAKRAAPLEPAGAA